MSVTGRVPFINFYYAIFLTGRLSRENLRDPSEGRKANTVFFPVIDAAPPYTLTLSKLGAEISFSINDLCVLEWRDDEQHGPTVGAGKIGFRQMAAMIAEYANLRVYTTEWAA